MYLNRICCNASMEERHLILISLVFSLIGLGILFVAAEKIELHTMKIRQVADEPLDAMVQVEGNVTNVMEKKDMMLVTVTDDSGKIELVFFEKTEVERGWNVRAVGKVSVYKSGRQILVSEMKRV